VTVPLLPLDDYLGLYDMRAVLEAHAASVGAARFSDDEIDRLDSLSRQMAEMAWSTQCEAMDDEFHSRLISGAGNESISAFLEILRSRGRHYRIFSHDMDGEMKAASDIGHARIVEALRARDPAMAATEATYHIRTTRRWLESIQPRPEVDG
jgi:DNA-binding GntR family transcriptional regulator